MNAKRIFFFLLLAGIFSPFSLAQTGMERQRVIDALSSGRDGRPLEHDVTLIDDTYRPGARFPQAGPIMLWTIGKDGRTGSLVGSVHLADESLYPLPDKMTHAFALADLVVLEVDPGELNQAFQMKLFQAGQLPEGRKLRDVIGAGTMKKLIEARARNMAPDEMDTLQPWYVALLMTFMELGRNTGRAFTPDQGIDRYFIKNATMNNKTIRGLESADEQLALFSSLTDEVGAALLDQTLDELNNIKEETRRILGIWKSGDTDALWRLVEENFRDYPALYQHGLVARNRAWAETIERLFEEDVRPFIVVGAAHLAGPDGLPALLQARGFEVRQEIEPGLIDE